MVEKETLNYLKLMKAVEIKRWVGLEKRNHKMREEMEEIIANTKAILEKEKEKREIQRVRRKKDKEEDQQIAGLKKQIKERERKAEALKREIRDKKCLIEGAYQYQLIREKEDELKDLEREHKRLSGEK